MMLMVDMCEDISESDCFVDIFDCTIKMSNLRNVENYGQS